MKTIQTLMLICCLAVFTACSNTRNPSLSGVYVSQGQSEFSVATDTLIIDAVSLAAKTYSVQSHVSFQRIRNGQKLPPEYKKETWQAVWNADQQVLSEGEYGRQIHVSADTPGVRLKNTLFRKIR